MKFVTSVYLIIHFKLVHQLSQLGGQIIVGQRLNIVFRANEIAKITSVIGSGVRKRDQTDIINGFEYDG